MSFLLKKVQNLKKRSNLDFLYFHKKLRYFGPFLSWFFRGGSAEPLETLLATPMFVMILVHFIWVFGPFLCILNFFASFYFGCFSWHISVGRVGPMFEISNTQTNHSCMNICNKQVLTQLQMIDKTLKVPLLIFH